MTLNSNKGKLFVYAIMGGIILYTSCYNKKQNKPITWLYGNGQIEMINGKVKTLTDFDPGVGKEFINTVYTFDKRGNIVSEEDIYYSGKNTIKYTTVYDKIGKRIETIGLGVDSLDHVNSRRIAVVYKYDNNERIASSGMFKYAGQVGFGYPTQDTYRFLYDKTSYLIERRAYYSDKEILGSIQKLKYLYSKTGYIIGAERAYTTEWTNFKVYHKDTIRYIVHDSHNNWLKATRFGDTLNRKITYY